MTRMTRILVVAGMVTLANPLGTVTGGANDLLAAEQAAAPVKHAVQANSDFAWDLYGQLAKENGGKNLFFSPYSISSALAMTAEGARGQTAKEMGTVLRLPDSTRRVGDDAQLIPWETAKMHTGMGAINKWLNRDSAQYQLEVIITELDQPWGGLDLTVALSTRWKLTKRGSSEPTWKHSIHASYTATFADAFAAIKRLRLANEGAARKSIAEGIRRISELNL